MTLYLRSFYSASSGLGCSGLADVSVILEFLLLNLLSFFIFQSLLPKGIGGVSVNHLVVMVSRVSPLSCRQKVKVRNGCLCYMFSSPATTLSGIVWKGGSGATGNGIQSVKRGLEDHQALTSVMQMGGTR